MTEKKHSHAQQPANQSVEDKTKVHIEKPEVAIIRIYIKDLSFEVPNSPEVFKEIGKTGEPVVDFQLNTTWQKISSDIYEVVLKISVGVKQGEKTTFLVELQQGGLFNIKHFPEQQLKQMLGAFCPNVLFPYAREIISDLVVRGTFPPFYLPPVNFDALYQQQEQGEKK